MSSFCASHSYGSGFLQPRCDLWLNASIVGLSQRLNPMTFSVVYATVRSRQRVRQMQYLAGGCAQLRSLLPSAHCSGNSWA